MTKPKDKKKSYEPPLIKEVGGVFEQAMGASACTTGNFFSTDPCSRGTTPGASCAGGSLDQACVGGGNDNTGCSRGFFVTGGGCTVGTGGG